MCKNEQNVVLNESSEVFGNHLKIVWILVLAITLTAEDDVWAEVILSEKLLLIFSYFTTKMGIFGVIGLSH